MVFSSLPLYLDPHNWQQQQQNHQQGGGGGGENPHFPAQPPPAQPHVGGSGGSIRPGSMADRARLAKVPQPEPGLKCPRCESSNTKFCYFNNYSLSQPRHFCKTCRRYWTRGGALRNVPVGGGCRRNKRSKSSASKSSVTTEQQTGAQSASTTTVPSNSNMDITDHFSQPLTRLPLMAPLQNLTTQYGAANLGLNFHEIQPQMGLSSAGGGDHHSDLGFQLGTHSGGGGAILSAGGGDQWRAQHIQHFPFLANFEPTTSFYPFQNSENVEAQPSSLVGENQQLRPITTSSGGNITQQAPVKMEDNQRLNLSKPILGISENNQYWVGNTWTDFSSLNSSSTSTSHLL